MKKYIKDTVYGATAEGLLYERFTKPTEDKLADLKEQYKELVEEQDYAATLKAVTEKVDAYVALS